MCRVRSKVVDPERLRFLFGTAADTVVDEFDLDDESERIAAVEQYTALPADAPARGVRMTIRAIAAAQIFGNEPAEVWSTAQRLEAGGLDSDTVLSQLTMVLGEHVSHTLEGNTFDTDAYVTDLAALPLPSPTKVASRLIDTVRSRQGINADDLIDAVVNELGGSTNAYPLDSLVDRVCETMTQGPLHWLPDDATVHVGDLVHGRTFTHRLSDAEAELDVLSVGFDLGWFVRFDTIQHPNGDVIEQFSVEHDHLAWPGDTGWLSDFEPGSLLAITTEVTGSGIDTFDATVTITTLDEEPVVVDTVVDAVRAGYDALVDEPGLPVSGEELALWLLHHHPTLFDQPQPPLAELCTAAGLDRNGGRVAHDDTIWRHELWHQRFTQVCDMVPETQWRHLLANALQILDDPDAPIDQVQAALDDCAEPETLDVLADALFNHHHFDISDEFERDSVRAPGRLFDLVNRATTVARRPRQTATAEYLACVLHERCAEPDVAEQHLKRAVEAQPRLGPIVERTGWYRFDRGDAPGAMKYWRTLTDPPTAAATIQPFLDKQGSGRKLGRNDPCWCGSGRKFKHCHHNTNELPALPDRVGWLCRKASLWLEHCVGDARRIVTEIAAARATGEIDTDPHEFASLTADELGDMFDTALADPIVFDAALHEEELFAHFLRERGPLFPDDEQLLAATWQLVDRSVHEIIDVDPGVGITVQDLATGDQLDVRERTASHTMQPGERYCARVVPDGHSHQIIGGIFPVHAGHETTVLDLCANGDGNELCAWVAALHQPPTLVHTPGLLDTMFDRDTIDTVLADAGPAGEAETIALLGAELSRQARSRWLDEHIPALDGLTPRQAAADPTRREQLERLLTDIDTKTRPATSGGFTPIEYNTPELRNELGLD